MTAPTVAPAAREYLAAVERELADLPADDRAELLEDLALHLAAIEEEDGAAELEARLGSPGGYAAELRAAAGLPARGAGEAPWRRRALDRAARLAGHPLVAGVVAFVGQLRPAWWVLRGYLVVLLPCLWHVSGARDVPVPAPYGNHLLGGVAVALAVTASVLVGRRGLPRLATVAVVAVDAAVVVAAVALAGTVTERLTVRATVVRYVPSPYADAPLVTRHGAVTNLFPYTSDGRPLQGVLLYDQDGRPLQVGTQLWWPDGCRRTVAQPRAVDGVPVRNSYPQQYVLDPAGVTLSGMPVGPGQCRTSVSRPKVPLPVFPGRPGTTTAR